MAGNMEDILMGGGSDSDSDDDNKAPAAAARPPSSAPAPPSTNTSKSDLTNRLKNLYAASPSNATAPVAPSALPRGGIQVPHLPNQPQQSSATSPSAGYNMPPPAPQQQQQQQPPPGYNHPRHPSSNPQHHMPAPLPKARSTSRSAPPANRMASVPQPSSQYPAQPHHSQQPPQNYQSRPLSSANYPPHPTAQRTAPRTIPQQHTVPPQQSKTIAPPRGSITLKSGQQPAPSQQMQHAQSSRPTSSRSSSQASSDGGRGELSDSEKKEKEKFLMFTRVLMKYLEQRDKEMHQKAKAQIKDCYEKNKSGDPAFKSLTQSMKARLRATVGEMYWKKAHDYLEHFFRQKKAVKDDPSKSQQRPPSSGGVPGQQQAVAPPALSTSVPPPRAVPPQQRMTQQQAASAAAMKMPISSGTSRPTIPGTNVPASSTSMILSATAAMSEAERKKKEEEEKRKKRNEANQRRRAANKKKKEEAEKHALLAKASMAGSAVGINVSGAPSLFAPTGINPLNVSGIGVGSGVLSSTPIAANTPSTIGGSSVSTTASTSSKKGKHLVATKKTLKKSLSISSVSSLKKKPPVVKEYHHLMEDLDHGRLIDIKCLPSILSKESISDFNLNEEQRFLLYQDRLLRDKVKEITDAAAGILSSDAVGSKLKEAGVPPLPSSLPEMYEGWSDRNVLSVRMAWAKVRLPEREMLIKERAKEVREKATRDKPMGDPPSEDKTEGQLSKEEGVVPPVAVANGSMAPEAPTSAKVNSPENEASLPSQKLSPPLKLEDDTTNHVWFNEARASQDPTLALLSEATELYLKSAVKKAIGKSRLRQNLDGVRLWNTLLTRNADSKNGTVAAPPPAVIRLGCDVRRQVALAEGNAAKTYQRMEEAITNRIKTHESADPDTMILESTSMADLSRKPPLKSAVQNANINAKRKFEVYGGKHSDEPPLGRVPKQARVLLQDMENGPLGNRAAARRERKMNIMASLFS